MAPWKDYEHLVRLAALFAGGVLVFLLMQAVLVPADFGETGHYRSSAVTANRQRTPVYAGEVACVECHSDVVEVRAVAAHRSVRCEACHGPQAAHVGGEGIPERPDAATLCGRCHTRNAARPRAFPQVIPREHAGGEACTSCHVPHAPGLS
jgi:Cytochrome c7 and related cytochrome c